jgi:hypothetical protein
MSVSHDSARPPVFTRDGDAFVPSLLAQGPWNPNAQHGGPVAALLAWLMEQVPSTTPMQFVRVTVDLMREVPLEPLTTQTRVVRAGRRIEVLESALLHQGREVARASGLRMRIGDQPVEFVAGYHTDGFDVPPGEADPNVRPPPSPPGAHVAGVLDASAIERVSVVHRKSSTAQMWTRLLNPLVDGASNTPLVRAMWASDISSAAGLTLDLRDYTSINPDMTVHFWRMPTSSRIGIRAVAKINPDGIGSSEAGLYDETGRFALAVASLLLEHRGRSARPASS